MFSFIAFRPTASVSMPTLMNVRALAAAAAAAARPKRPATSFILFANEKRADMLRRHPDKRITEINKFLGKEWKSLPEREKIVYTQKYEIAKEKFDAAHEKYMATRNPDEIARDKKDARKKAAKKDPNRPKRPLSGFMYFTKDVRGSLDKSLHITEHSKIIGARWRTLSDQDKKKYERLYQEDKKRYDREMEAYTKK